MPEKYIGAERREAVRLEQVIPVEYNLINEVKSISLSRKRKGIIQNISAKGLRLQLEELLDEGLTEGLYSGIVKLGLEFKVPGKEETIRVLAKMLWLTKVPLATESTKTAYVMGLEFIDITTFHQDIIRDYVIRSYLEGKTG